MHTVNSDSGPTMIDFWFDAACPFAWVTSRWIQEVQRVRDVQVAWRPMSLAVLNEGRELAQEYREFIDQTWLPARAASQIFHQYGHDILGAYYTHVGSAIHYGAEKNYEKVVTTALDDLGLDPDIGAQSTTDIFDSTLRTLHHEGVSLVGEDLGTPIMAIGGNAFFGPVITRVPRGEEAGAIFDAALALTSYPYFFEIKRARTERPQFDMSDEERLRDTTFHGAQTYTPGYDVVETRG